MYNHPFPVNTNDIHQRKLILILPFLIGPFVFDRRAGFLLLKTSPFNHGVPGFPNPAGSVYPPGPAGSWEISPG